MLIEFTIGNFRSIKEPVTLSMVAAKLTSQDPQVDINNTFQADDDLKLLTSAAIYGANASGKSNIVKALVFMKNFVRNSSRESQADDLIGVVPFRLDAETEIQPSYFEVVFQYKNIQYRYGFEVTQERVISEWLFYSPHGKEAELFTRVEDDIKPGRALKGARPLITNKNTRPNALFLSVASQFNVEIARIVAEWFSSIAPISGFANDVYGGYTIKKFREDDEYRSEIMNLIHNSDVGINNILVEKGNVHDPAFLPKVMPQKVKERIREKFAEDEEAINLKTLHQIADADGKTRDIFFDINDESEGTQKLFFLSGPVFNSLRSGRILVVDEIEASMHTLLTTKLVGLFNSPITNPNHAQLIFATHDTNLLSKELFRRDQIWFVEKDQGGASHLYSLAELKVKNERIYENDYLQGRYGAIPVLGNLSIAENSAKYDETHASE